MEQWYQAVQQIIDEIDLCIKSKSDEILTLRTLSKKLGYSEFTSPESSGSFPA